MKKINIRLIIITTIVVTLLFVVLWSMQNSSTEQMEQKTQSQRNQTLEEKIGFGGLISSAEFFTKMNSNEYIVLDVRTPKEYNDQRIEDNATLVNFYDSDFKEQLNKLPKDKKYLLYCRSGNRSSKTVPIMEELGFENFYELQGGIKNWNSAGLPIFSGK